MESSTPMLQPLLPIFKEEEEPGEGRKCTRNVFFTVKLMDWETSSPPRVGLLAPSGGQHVAAQWAIWMAGAVAGGKICWTKCSQTFCNLELTSVPSQFPCVPPTPLPA